MKWWPLVEYQESFKNTEELVYTDIAKIVISLMATQPDRPADGWAFNVLHRDYLLQTWQSLYASVHHYTSEFCLNPHSILNELSVSELLFIYWWDMQLPKALYVVPPLHGRVVRVEIDWTLLWAITITMLQCMDIWGGGMDRLTCYTWLLLLPIATPVVDSRLQFTLILCLEMSGIRERHLTTDPLTPTAITPTCFVRHHACACSSVHGTGSAHVFHHLQGTEQKDV
jgi:hypothetical protein